MTGPTILQQKTVEHFSQKGRVVSVKLRQKSVECLVLSRSFWGFISSYVAGQVIHYHSSKHMRWQILPRVQGFISTHFDVKISMLWPLIYSGETSVYPNW